MNEDDASDDAVGRLHYTCTLFIFLFQGILLAQAHAQHPVPKCIRIITYHSDAAIQRHHSAFTAIDPFFLPNYEFVSCPFDIVVPFIQMCAHTLTHTHVRDRV